MILHSITSSDFQFQRHVLRSRRQVCRSASAPRGASAAAMRTALLQRYRAQPAGRATIITESHQIAAMARPHRRNVDPRQPGYRHLARRRDCQHRFTQTVHGRFGAGVRDGTQGLETGWLCRAMGLGMARREILGPAADWTAYAAERRNGGRSRARTADLLLVR